MDKSFGLSEAEIAQATELLARLEPGFLPYSLFLQVYRLTPAPVLQVIPFRHDERGGIEVLLIRRPPDDPLFANLWHNPGTVIRSTDTLKSTIDRLLNDELYKIRVTSGPHFVSNKFHRSPRGAEIVQIYWIEAEEPVPTGMYWPVHNLPKDMLTTEIPIIETAGAHYKKWLP